MILFQHQFEVVKSKQSTLNWISVDSSSSSSSPSSSSSTSSSSSSSDSDSDSDSDSLELPIFYYFFPGPLLPGIDVKNIVRGHKYKQNGHSTGHTMRQRIFEQRFYQGHFMMFKIVKSNKALTEEAIKTISNQFAHYFDDGDLDLCLYYSTWKKYHPILGELFGSK